MEYVSCPLCEATQYETVLRGRDRMLNKPGEFQLVKCDACSLHFLNPRPTRQELTEFYGDGYTPHARGKSKHREGVRRTIKLLKERITNEILQYYLGYPIQDRRLWLLKKAALAPFFVRFRLHERNWQKLPYHGDGAILDVGTGAGGFLSWMQQHGWKTCGIDISPTAMKLTKQKGLDVVMGDLLETDYYRLASFDVVTMWDVLEHLSAPLPTLKKVHTLLKPHGRLIAAVPNIDSLPARLFGKHWFPHDIPRHLVGFSPATIESMLTKAGFRVDKIKFRRRGATIPLSVAYLPDGIIKSLCRILSVRKIHKLLGTILALCHQSGEMVVFATKIKGKED